MIENFHTRGTEKTDYDDLVNESTRGTEKLITDDIFDFSMYPSMMMKQRTTRYRCTELE